MSKLFLTCFAATSSLFCMTEENLDDLFEQEVSREVVLKSSCGVKKQREEIAPCAPAPVKPACAAAVPLPSQPCPDRFRLSGGFLYLLPTVDDTYFVIDAGTTSTYPQGVRQNNDFGYKPAFRVGVEYALCDKQRSFETFYSYLSASQDRTISDSHLWASIASARPDLISSYENYSGTASSSLNLLYQNLDVNFTQQVINSYGINIYIQPGIEYAYLRLNENYLFNTGAIEGKVDLKSRTWGIGPQIGMSLDYTFFNRALTCSTTQTFSITSFFAGSILMGRGKTSNFQTNTELAATPITTNIVDIHDEHTCRTIPAFHARVGLDYLVRGSRFGASLGIGYEFNTYVRGASRTIFPDDVADGLCSTDYYNFDIQGLSVMAAISF